MPIMTVRATNATFESVNTEDYPDPDAAYAAGVAAALEIAAGEVRDGAASSIVQVTVEAAGGAAAARGAVAVSSARLLVP